MKNIKDSIQNIFENQSQKTIAFFVFYFFFFLVVFLLIFFRGDKDYLNQEYEKGDTTSTNTGILGTNFLFDYKVEVDHVLHDYYGKHYQDRETFKYNNLDYYHEKEEFYSYQDSWITVENPYVFYEFLDFDSLKEIMSHASFIKKEEGESNTTYYYQISSNTLNEILYGQNTDYDDVPDTITILTDQKNRITQIVYQLDTFCKYQEKCLEQLKIEMNFDMLGEIGEIESPIQS